MSDRLKFTLLFISVFAFRLAFGLCQSNWSDYDEKQTYLTGLKFYTTGTWPTFGPDAGGSESSFHSQIPGALEGLVVGLPLYVLPLPEAPFIALNLFSTAGVLLLAWYIHRRMPTLSFHWLCVWLAIAPWSVYYPTHISNMSYLFLPSILFFIGFLESLPAFSLNLIRLGWANAFMGFSLFWTMQFHLSWVFLIPLAAFSMGVQLKNSRRPTCLLYFTLGALPPLAFVVPTYFQYGWSRINSHSAFFVPLNWDNARAFFTLLARFLSLACFELPTFIGAHTVERITFLENHPLILAPGAFLWVAGLLQPFVLLFCWFKKDHLVPRWRETKWLLLGVFATVYLSFWFTIKAPLSHIYLVLLPLVMIYSCYCWMFFARNARCKTLAKVFVVLGLFFQAGYAVSVAPRDSLYTQRALVAKAIQEKNYRLLGERTAGDLY